MTEYWVSQGNKWCDYCKIYIANNATSISTHEHGTRHKENLAKKLAAIRKDNAVKEKEKLAALKDLERIEAQAKKSYEKDLAAIRQSDVAKQELEHRSSTTSRTSTSAKGVPGSKDEGSANEWTYDEASGYHFNAATCYYYDPNSGLYYSDILGKWTTQEAALKASQDGQCTTPSGATVKSSKQPRRNQNVQIKSPSPALQISKDNSKSSKDAAPKVSIVHVAPVVVNQGPVRVGKGVASSLDVRKRKSVDPSVEKSGPVSREEAVALAAREAARKRTQEREKALLGLYQAY